MKTLCGLIVCLCLLVATASRAADAEETKILVTFADPDLGNVARAGPVRPGYNRRSSSYVVSLEVRRAARRIEREFGLELLDEWPIDPLKVHCIVYAVGDNDDVDALLGEIRPRPGVDSAQRLNTFEVMGPAQNGQSDRYAGLQSSIARLGLTAAHRLTLGQGSHVTIIDTGADTEHPDLRSRIDEHIDFVEGYAREIASDAHGTAVAGIIGASSDNGIGIVGVAPGASMTVLKSCWYVDQAAHAVCDTFTLATALSFAIDSATQVINLSLAGPEDPLLTRLVEHALAAGKIVVAAAPAADRSSGFPALIDGVIVVHDADGPGERLTGAVYAPGRDILVPVPGGGFDFASGSSLSAAHVSGIVALLLAREPALKRHDVHALLAAASPDASISACRALAALLEEPVCGTATADVDKVAP